LKRVLLSAGLILVVAAFVVVAGGAGSSGSSQGQYKIELDSAFGLVNDAQFKVAGVPAGKVTQIEVCKLDTSAICQNPLHAVATVSISSKGFDSLRSDAYCRTRPESLIGEYFIDCQPGSTGQLLTPGSHNPDCNKTVCTIPVSHTASTIPFDLINNIMRMPYRERFTLIINELGAAVAGRGGDLQAALQRAVPALQDTDNLLNLLANDSNTLKALTVNSDQVLTELANNSKDVQNFIVEANNAASDTATQQNNLRASIHNLPPFLEQLKPAMAKLDTAAVENTPVLQNLNEASGHSGGVSTGTVRTGIDQLKRLFSDVPPFASASLPALRSLGQASLTGRPAMVAALPTVKHLNQFAQPVPELAQNLSILTQDLDTQNRAVEPDSRSPGGKGFTGLQAVLQYVFNQPLAINAYSQFGHLLTVDAFANQYCSPYATPQRIANNLATNPTATRQCYSWLGPNQQGINVADPSNPGGCVPDPGYSPPGEPKPTGPIPCKLQPNPAGNLPVSTPSGGGLPSLAADKSSRSSAGSQSAAAASTPPASSASSGIDLQKTLGQMFSSLAADSATQASAANSGNSGSSNSSTAAGQAQQLLNYLLAP
jgi:ABC-type transporter Mla subunit MlaD